MTFRPSSNSSYVPMASNLPATSSASNNHSAPNSQNIPPVHNLQASPMNSTHQSSSSTSTSTTQASFSSPNLHSVSHQEEHEQISRQACRFEIMTSIYLTAHGRPFTQADELFQLLKSTLTDSNILSHSNLHRKKVASIINNKASPFFRSKIIQHLRTNKFSIMFDESTDISVTKCCAIVVRTLKNHKVSSFFYRLIECPDGRAETLFHSMKNAFDGDQIPFANITGYASDGASNVSGCHNSLGSRLEREIPNLFRLKCLCHNAHLISLKARTALPSSVEELIFKVSSYFSNSPRRIDAFLTLQEDLDQAASRIPKASKIRWLTLHRTTSSILRNWTALSVLFTQESQNDQISLDLLRTLRKPHTKAYLMFSDSCLNALEAFNRIFQSESTLVHNFQQKIEALYLTFLERCMNSSYISENRNSVYLIDPGLVQHQLMPSNIHLSPSLTSYLETLEESARIVLRSQFHSYYFICCHEIKQRYFINSFIHERLAFLSPRNAFDSSPRRIDIAYLLRKFEYLLSEQNEIDSIDEQWRTLKHDSEMQMHMNLTPEEFWIIVQNNAAISYDKLGTFALNLLTLPLSTADVERIFSSITFIKNKYRNRMHTLTLENILCIKTGLKFLNKTSTTFEPPVEMLLSSNSPQSRTEIASPEEELMVEIGHLVEV